MDSPAPESSLRDGYSLAFIRKLLDNYVHLEEGHTPRGDSGYEDYWGPRVRRGSQSRGSHEMPVLMKCDIDRAIQQLPIKDKLAVYLLHISGRSLEDCLNWLRGTVKGMVAKEDRAVRRMGKTLNGYQDDTGPSSGSWGGSRPGAGRKKSTEKE